MMSCQVGGGDVFLLMISIYFIDRGDRWVGSWHSNE